MRRCTHTSVSISAGRVVSAHHGQFRNCQLVQRPPQIPDTTRGQSVFGQPLFCAARGADYYFPPESNTMFSSLQRSRPQKCDGVQTVLGTYGPFTIDASKPPITTEEMLSWRLDKHVYAGVQPVHFMPNAREPLFLLPPHAPVTSLGPDVDALDRVFRQKGQFTLSEMAEAFFPAVPTFYVETSHVFRSLPSNVLFRLDSLLPRGMWVSVLLARYPMLFKLKRPKFRKSVVKLNSELWFVRAHPAYGHADHAMRAHSAEYRPHGGGMLHKHAPHGTAAGDRTSAAAAVAGSADGALHAVTEHRRDRKPLDLHIFDILLSHLPRVPADIDDAVAKRYAPVRLVDWINTFPQADLDRLNLVSQERVIALLAKYTHVFQLMTTPRGVIGGDPAAAATAGGSLADEVGQNLFMDSAALVARYNPGVAPEGGPRADPVTRPAPTAAPSSTSQPNRMMRGALQDDIVGLDDLISEHLQEIETAVGNAVFEDLTNDPCDGKQPDASVDAEADWNDEELVFDSDGTPPPQQQTRVELLPPEDDEIEFSRGDGDTDGDPAPVEDNLVIKLETLFVRRMPPGTAPRSLSDLTAANSPDPQLVVFAASFLNPPPSLRRSAADGPRHCRGLSRVTTMEPKNIFDEAAKAFPENTPRVRGLLGDDASKLAPHEIPAWQLWRWVPVERIYTALNRAQQRRLRRAYKGLVSFLRLHGALFELSADFKYVIAHDPGGVISPLVPTQMRFSFEERVVLPAGFDDASDASAASASLLGEEARSGFEEVMGDSQLPTTRQQLVLLDPNNPLLHHEVLEEEIAALVPPTGPMDRTALMRAMPPLIRAALANRFNLSANRLLITWNESGRSLVQRRELGVPAGLDTPLLGPEEAIEALREGIPVCGATVRAIARMHLSNTALRSLQHHYSGIYNAAVAYPHYFRVTNSGINGRNDALVELIAV